MPDATFSGISTYAIAFFAAYALGSVPFGLLLTKSAGLGDIRDIGSGNIGATNVLRTGNKKLAAATLFLDMLKGTVAVLIAGMFGPFYAMAAGVGAFVGHLYPLWLNFKGGKGVATYLGVLAGLAWQGALVFAAVWLLVAYLFRYSSLAALVAAAVVPGALYMFGFVELALLFSVLSIIVIIKHKANIERLLAGTETRIGKK
jgi:glycerol-3-phosphate acyltransferase PlsY